MDVEDGGDMSAWRATRRLPWKRGDQIHPARPSPFQILTSTTLDTTLTWSCRWCLHLCHLVQSQRIGNLGLPRTHVVCWDHVLGRRGGRRRCPSCCWRHSGPLFQRSSRFASEWFVFTWALLHELQPPIPPSSGAILGGRAAVSSLRTSRPAKDLRDRHRPRLSSLRACLPGPAVYDAETSSSPRSRDTIRTRCLPDSDALSLSAHVHRHHHQTLGSKTTAAMPCARHEDSVPLVAVAEEACRGNPLFRCFEFFGATLPFESNRTIAKSLHAALAAAGPCSPRLTLDGRMGMIPAGLNFQRPRPSANRVGDRPGTRTMALGMAATTVTTHTHGRLPPGRPFPVRP